MLVVSHKLSGLYLVMQLYSFTLGHWMGMPASPRCTAGLRCRCYMVTMMSSSLSVEWALVLLQVSAS